MRIRTNYAQDSDLKRNMLEEYPDRRLNKQNVRNTIPQDRADKMFSGRYT